MLVANFVDDYGEPFRPAFEEPETDSFSQEKACIEQAANSKFLDLARHEPRCFLKCSIDLLIVWIKSKQFNPTLDHIAHILVQQLQCAPTPTAISRAASSSFNTAISRSSPSCDDFIPRLSRLPELPGLKPKNTSAHRV